MGDRTITLAVVLVVFAISTISASGWCPTEWGAIPGGKTFRCVKHAQCTLSINGYNLRPDNSAQLVNVNGTNTSRCGTDTAYTHSFTTARTLPDNLTSSPTLRTFHFGEAWKEGVFLVCYCPTYDMEEDADIVKCNSHAEYCQEAGFLRISGVASGEEYHCVKKARCGFNVTGAMLNAQDHAQIIPYGEGQACGGSSQVANPGNFTLSRIPAEADDSGPDAGWKAFSTGVSWLEGRYLVCYCADYAHSKIHAPCGSDADYIQLAGTLTVRGSAGTQLWECVKNATCELTVRGYALSTADMVQIIAYDEDAGSISVADACTHGNPFNESAFQKGRTSSAGGAGSHQLFRLGVALTQDTYTVCYCARYDEGTGGLHNASAFCDGDREFSHQAGTLVVRGSKGNEHYRCHKGNICHITIAGWGMQATDHAQIVPFGQYCGLAHKVSGFIMNPVAELLLDAIR